MTRSRRTITALLLPLVVACNVAEDDRNQPMFTSGDNGETVGDGGTVGESGDDMSTSGDGDGDSGDGDGDDSGDGDGDDSGDGDGDDSGDGDGDGDTGNDCTTDPTMVGTSCGQGSAYQGAYGLGDTNTDMPIGAIMGADNGPGDGAEDWYQIDFPLDVNNPRPLGGMATVSFAMNEGNDYRFEVYRDCGAQAYGQGLASEFGANSPPLTEWSFHDLELPEEQLEYTDNITWPATMWLRVFRFQNDQTCSHYQLQIIRN